MGPQIFFRGMEEGQGLAQKPLGLEAGSGGQREAKEVGAVCAPTNKNPFL